MNTIQDVNFTSKVQEVAEECYKQYKISGRELAKATFDKLSEYIFVHPVCCKPYTEMVTEIQADGTSVSHMVTKKIKNVERTLSQLLQNTLDPVANIQRIIDESSFARPALEHTPNEKEFVKNAAVLFYNTDAYSVGTTLTNFRIFCQNIHKNLLTTGSDMSENQCLYQYSALGGTGKSEFGKVVVEAMKQLGYDAGPAKIKGRWIGNEFSRLLVSFDDEFMPPKGTGKEDFIEKFNPIVANDYYEVEYKGQDKYFCRSITSLIVNSNYLPFDTNLRRYGVVKYNEHSIIKDDRKPTFEKMVEAFKVCLKTVPFNQFWENPIKTASRSLSELIWKAREVRNGGLMVSTLKDCTIRTFVNDYIQVSGSQVKPISLQREFTDLIISNDIKPTHRINGQLEYSKYNFEAIADMDTVEESQECSLDIILDDIDRTKKAFENILGENPDPTDPTKIDREEKELNDTATATAATAEPTEPSGPSEPSGKTTEGNELAFDRGGNERAEATDTANDTTFEPAKPSITDRRPFDLAAWEENMKKEIVEESKKEIKIEPVTDVAAFLRGPDFRPFENKPEITVEAVKELEKQLPDIPPVFYEPLEPETKAEAKTEAKTEENTLEMINDNYELQDIFSAICADVNGTLTEEQKDTLSLKPKKVSEEKHLLSQQEMDEVKNYFDEICGISVPTEPTEPTEPPKTEYEYPEGFDLSQKKLTKEDVEKFDIQVVSEATNKTGHLEPLATDQFIVAARLKDKSQGLIRRTDLMEPVFFVYESDSLSIPEQQRILGPMRTIPSIFSMTYSGSKSIHTLVYIDPKDRDIVSQDYKFFWQTIGEELFGENAKYLDPACASIVRLTRLPGGFRYDTGKDQKCLYINRKCCGVNIVKANAKYQQKLLDIKRRQEETARKLEAFRLSGREPGNPDDVKHLENLFKKTNDQRAEIALTLLNGGDPGSGANYIGAIGYVNAAVGPETAEKVRQAAHQLHPSNITKIA